MLAYSEGSTSYIAASVLTDNCSVVICHGLGVSCASCLLYCRRVDEYVSTGTDALGNGEGFRHASSSAAAPAGLLTVLRPFLVAWEQLVESRFEEAARFQELRSDATGGAALSEGTRLESTRPAPAVSLQLRNSKLPLSGWVGAKTVQPLPQVLERPEASPSAVCASFSLNWCRYVERTLSAFWEEVAAAAWLHYSSISGASGADDQRGRHLRALVRLYLAAPARILTQQAAQGVLSIVLGRSLADGRSDPALAEAAFDLLERFVIVSRQWCHGGLEEGRQGLRQMAPQQGLPLRPLSGHTPARQPSEYLPIHGSGLQEEAGTEPAQIFSPESPESSLQSFALGTGEACEMGVSSSSNSVVTDSFCGTPATVLKTVLPHLAPYITAAVSVPSSAVGEEAKSSLREFAVSEVRRAKKRALQVRVADSPGAPTAGSWSLGRRRTSRVDRDSFKGESGYLPESEREQANLLREAEDPRQDFGLRILRFLGDLGPSAQLVLQQTDKQDVSQRSKDAPVGELVNRLQAAVALAATETDVGDGVGRGKAELQRQLLQLPLQVVSPSNQTAAGTDDGRQRKGEVVAMLRLEEIASEALAAASTAVDRQQRLSACELLYALFCYVHGQANRLLDHVKEQKDKKRWSATFSDQGQRSPYRQLMGHTGKDSSEFSSLLRKERACRVLVAALYGQLLPPMLRLCSGSGGDSLTRELLQPLVWTVLQEVADESCKRWGEDGVPDERVRTIACLRDSTSSAALLLKQQPPFAVCIAENPLFPRVSRLLPARK